MMHVDSMFIKSFASWNKLLGIKIPVTGRLLLKIKGAKLCECACTLAVHMSWNFKQMCNHPQEICTLLF